MHSHQNIGNLKKHKNDKMMEEMFATPVSTILAFFSIVIIAPMTEEFFI